MSQHLLIIISDLNRATIGWILNSIWYVPDVLVFPIGLNGLIEKKWVSFEYGAGISAAIYMNGIANDLAYVNMTNKFDCIDFAKAGIRVNPKNKGLFFNFYWKPHVNKVETIWGWFGRGIG